ncbi:PAS domain-containing sensor histidine kinase [Pseudomonas aegrilactucae]|uniref:histidine kinase n=1 Tax=Pseudomonas aegrilactucae TaxID=2854028 RepID=A0A9Q2XH22_9PSED|nr:PAS domain-containing sensor histidine kinase [Pseudomonas aegrilactucae]MBV6286581.1 PAS domain-containing protein [Pseudomonas aegrilactucae]
MSGGQRLFERWRPRPGVAAPQEQAPPAVGLQVWLDDQGRVLRVGGPLGRSLARVRAPGAPVHDYLQAHSRVVLEGTPVDWQAQPLDLAFDTLSGHTLHTRGWLLAHAEGWLLQLFDVGDLLQQRQQGLDAQHQQQLALQMAAALRGCSLEHLAHVAGEQVQHLAWHWRCGWAALLLRTSTGWQTFARSEAPAPWADETRLGVLLDSLEPEHLLRSGEHLGLQGLFAHTPLWVLGHAQQHRAQAWLLCADDGVQGVPGGARVLLDALAEPLLARLADGRLQASQQRLDNVQGLLGAGWWEWSLHEPYLQLAPGLAASLGVDAQLSVPAWLAVLHPADREAAQLAFEAVQREGGNLQVCVRLHRAPLCWYRVCGQVQGHGFKRRLHGFMLDISDIRLQQQQASAAHARLDNLIASSPAVIYIQRYEAGALHAEFFSASLQPLLGWAADAGQQPAQWVHPDDQGLWLQRTRTLLRDGQVRSRYRLCDSRGEYHWVLDEARLLRDDLGLPVEAVGLWLDVTEATLAGERIRESEERYRVLVEDSPAMICRYRPDLSLVFGNRPLADYLECAPAQLPGLNLGQWMSLAQREAFVQRLAGLTPQQPVSSAEICLQLPGREHAWWVWSDRGVFDAAGRLLEVQAVGRDNTALRRSQQQLLQSAKMATLGEMSTGLAHEINQPLNVMRMALVNALKRLESGEVEVDYLREKLKRIDAQVVRASRVVDHMRVFGRRSEVEPQVFEAWQAIDGALSLLADGLAGKGVELRVNEAQAGCRVCGHPDQLEQVLINLMVNARDALLGRRDAEPQLRPWIAVHLERVQGWVRLQVQDNAGGIEPRLLERIFEPFFTTKPSGVGTGLGLSVSCGIIERMGGLLSARNGDEGACFVIELPLYSTS